MQDRIRDIKITPALNGYIVQCGCQTIVFEGVPSLVSALDRYLTNPTKTEQEFLEKALNKPDMQVPRAPTIREIRAADRERMTATDTAAVPSTWTAESAPYPTQPNREG